ncbi:hypothetical protein C882_3935 [Caenispirillum salinarum AK4]|uniref:Uncharacterized protein n=2 Tax=Caenispirillum TaxID=414051 RepID=K9H1Y0_9PROT|nr:hypothetical protein C882_3935 [Caenispirillum salinarum AK4]
MPGRQQFEGFVGAGLKEVPGVGRAQVTARLDIGTPEPPAGWQRFPLVSGTETFGVVDFRIDDPEQFAPYADDLRNAMNLLALELERRAMAAALEDAQTALERAYDEMDGMAEENPARSTRSWG